MAEGAESESVLNEMLGQYGCEHVEELDLEQAGHYGKALKAIYEEHVRKQAEKAIDESPF